MRRAIKMFQMAHPQTKFFIFTFTLYMIAIIWTTVIAYARLQYSRTDGAKPILIETQSSDYSYHHDKKTRLLST